MSQYKQLAHGMMTDIDTGKIQPGDKLMSVRAMSQQHSVSITTVLNCYAFMQDRGYANTKPKSGYFAQKPLVDLKEAPLLAFSGSLAIPADFNFRQTRQAFSTAQLSPDFLPEKNVINHINHAIKAHIKGNLDAASIWGYGDVQGAYLLREALSKHYGAQGFSMKSDDLVVGNGCLDSVRVAVEVATKPGDTIVVASPCFTGLLDILRLTHRNILEIPSAKAGIDLEQLESIVQQKRASALLLTANFQNPLGHGFSNQHKKAIAQLANTYRFPVIEDDVYQELSFSGVTPLPIKHWDEKGDVLWCSSFSKTLCASFRVGWCLPGKYLEPFKERRKIESLGVNSPLQLAIADLIATGGYKQHLKKVVPQIRLQVQQYRQTIAELLGDKVAISNPDGGLVLWCYVKGLDSRKLAEILYYKNIGIRPGRLFSTRDFYEEYFRINCGWALNEQRLGELKVLCEEVGNCL